MGLITAHYVYASLSKLESGAKKDVQTERKRFFFSPFGS
jgi:hypothetical protein